MSSYDFEFQCDIVLGAMMLHNFIRINQEEDDEFDIWDLDEEDIDNEENLDNEGGNNDVHHVEKWYCILHVGCISVRIKSKGTPII